MKLVHERTKADDCLNALTMNSLKGKAVCRTKSPEKPDKPVGKVIKALKVWSTVKIRGTRVTQKAIVPVGRPRPYYIKILNMRFIPKASLRASSQITGSSYILKRHLWVNISKPLALAPTWSLACKQTDCITVGMWKLLDPKLVSQTLYICSMLGHCWASVADVGLVLKQHWINVSFK